MWTKSIKVLAQQVFPKDLVVLNVIAWLATALTVSALYKAILKSLLLAFGCIQYPSWFAYPMPVLTLLLIVVVMLVKRNYRYVRHMVWLVPILLLTMFSFAGYVLSRQMTTSRYLPHLHPVSDFVHTYQHGWLAIPDYVFGFTLGTLAVFLQLRQKYNDHIPVWQTIRLTLIVSICVAVLLRSWLDGTYHLAWVAVGPVMSFMAIRQCRQCVDKTAALQPESS